MQTSSSDVGTLLSESMYSSKKHAGESSLNHQIIVQKNHLWESHILRTGVEMFKSSSKGYIFHIIYRIVPVRVCISYNLQDCPCKGIYFI